MSSATCTKRSWQEEDESIRIRNAELLAHQKRQSVVQEESRKKLQTLLLNSRNRRQQQQTSHHQPMAIDASATSTSTYSSLNQHQLIAQLEEKDKIIDQKNSIIKNLHDLLSRKAPAVGGAKTPIVQEEDLFVPQDDSRQTIEGSKPVGVDELVIPSWYQDFKLKNPDRAEATALKGIKALAKSCKNSEGEALRLALQDLQDTIQKYMFKKMRKDTLKLAAVLEGLQYVATSQNIPWYIQADARELFKRWASGNVGGDLLFGIRFGGRNKSGTPEEDFGANGTSLEKEYASKASYREYGPNGLENGQWWPKQICTLRDGAHGAAQGGISGLVNLGAFSIVMSSHSEYTDSSKGDVDNGDEIWYTGTRTKDVNSGVPSSNTQLMIDAYKNKKQIRVIRSHDSNKSKCPSIYAPSCGYRYDGLYEIVDIPLCVDQATQHYRFHLKRLPGQLPIRYQEQARRPNKWEEREKTRIASLQSGGQSRS